MASAGISSVRGLAIQADVPPTTLAAWMSGTRPPADAVVALADTLGVSVEYLMTGIERGSKVPLYKAPANAVSGRAVVSDTPDGMFELLPGQRADFCVQITGNCLAPEFRHNDVVSMRIQPVAESGQYALIEVLATGERMVKQAHRGPDGRIVYRPHDGGRGYGEHEARVLAVVTMLVQRKYG